MSESYEQQAEREMWDAVARSDSGKAVRKDSLELLEEAADESKCDGCPGDGVYYGAGRVENGKFIGFTGTCFRCGGKGHTTAADVKRNTYYDNHVRRIHA